MQDLILQQKRVEISLFDWKQLPHFFKGSNLVPSDFHLFGLLIEFLHGTKFKRNIEVKSTMNK